MALLCDPSPDSTSVKKQIGSMSDIQKDDYSLTARTIWFIGARIISFAFSFGLPLLLVRRMSQHEFGVYKQLFLLIGTAIVTLPLGFATSAFYFLPRERTRQGEIAFNILLFHAGIGGIIAITLILFPGLLTSLFNNVELSSYASPVGLLALVWILAAPLDTFAIANQETKVATVFIVSSQLVKAIVLFSAALLVGSVRALIYAAIIHGALQIGVLIWYLRSRFGAFWRAFDSSIMRRQMAYALPLGAAAILFRTYSDLHNYYVSYEFGAAAYAIYAVGCFNILLPDVVTEAVGSVLIPRVSYLQSQNQRAEIIQLLARMLRKVAALFFPLYVLLLVIGRDFITVLFTEQYLASWPIFAINLTLIPLALIPSAYDPVVRAYPEYRFFLIRVRAALLLVLIAALVFLTTRFGLVGAISAVVLVAALENVITGTKSAKVIGVTRADLLLLKDVAKIAVAAIVAGVISWIILHMFGASSPLFKLILGIFMFGMAYIGAILLFRIITPQECNMIKTQISRFTIPSKRDPVHEGSSSR